MLWEDVFVPPLCAALLCHEELHDGACRLRYIRAWTKDGGYACLVEEVVVLCGDDTTGNHHDVLATEFLQFINHLRHEGLVSCCERGDTLHMHIVLYSLLSRLGRSLEQRPISIS